MEDKKIKIKDLKEGGHFIKKNGIIYYIEILDNGVDGIDFTTYDVPTSENDTTHLFLTKINGRNYLVNNPNREWYLNESHYQFDKNEEIEIFDGGFINIEDYLINEDE